MTTLYRHLKRGTLYRVLHDNVPMQNSADRRWDDEPVVVYQSMDSHAVYVRPTAEFYDGRFVAVPLEEQLKASQDYARALLEVLTPFIHYADPHRKVPPETIITAGSSMGKRQLTMGDCYAILDALKVSS